MYKIPKQSHQHHGEENTVRKAELMYEREDGEDLSEILFLDTTWLLKA